MTSWCRQYLRRPNPKLGAALLLLGMAFGASPALAEIASGTYTGDDSPGRLINGLGFQPVLVIVKGDLPETGVIRTDIYQPGNSKQMCTPALEITDGITDFTSDGFIVDRGPGVNSPGIEYHWVAFSSDPGSIKTSWYSGNGNPDHWVNGVGFLPEVVMVFGRNDQPVQFRTIDMPDDFSTSFQSEGLNNNRIEFFAADSFRLGSDPAVNESLVEYAYVAFNADAAKVVHGLYTGNGGPDQDIGGLGIGPDFVIVKGFDSTAAVQRSKALSDPTSSFFRNLGNIDDGVVDLRGDHFTVGTSNRVNQNTRTYYYVAFEAANGFADLDISQSVNDVTADVGQELTFDINLWNNNGPDRADNITVDVALPVGLTYTGDFTLNGSFDSGTGVWSAGNLDPNFPAFLRVTATVDPGMEGQTLTVVSTISGMDQSDPDGTNNSASTDVIVSGTFGADLALSTWWDDDAPDEGQQVKLTVYLSNFGPDTADNITVSVPVPAGLTFVSANAWYGSIYDEGTQQWSLPPLEAGWDTQLDITAMVNTGTAGSTVTASSVITGSTPADPVPANDSASASLIVNMADLAVAISADNLTPLVGQDINYTVDLVNSGPNDATGIRVDLTPDAGLDYLSSTMDSGSFNPGNSYWTVPALASGGSTQLRLLMRPLAGSEGDTLTTICEVVEVDEADSDVSNNLDSVDVIVVNVDLAVAMVVDDPAPDEGQQVAFTVDLDNIGGSDVTGSAVTVTLPVGLTYVGHTPGTGTYDSGTGVWTVGPMAVAGNAQLQVDATVDAGTGGATLSTSAALSALDQVDGNGSNNSASVDLIVAAADLSVAMAVDDPTPIEGQQVVYTIDLDNLGPADATGTAVTVTLPAGLTYVGDTPGTGTFNSGTGLWTVGPLSAAESAQLQVTASVDPGTTGSVLTTTAAVSASDMGDPNGTNNTASTDVSIGVTPNADLALTLVADVPNALEAQQVVYTIDVNNLGPSVALGAAVTFTLPAGLTYVSDVPDAGTFNGGTGIWDLGDLAVSGSARLEVTASVDAGTAGSALTTSATATSDLVDFVGANNSASVDVDVLASADLGLTAVFTNFNPLPGDAQGLTVVLANNGPNTATAIAVDVTYSPDLTLVDATATQGSWDGGTGAWLVPSLAAGATDTLVVNLTVGAVPGGTELSGTATVSGLTEIDPAAGNDTAAATMIVLAPGEIRLVAEPFEDSGRSLLPGGPVEDVLRLALINDSAFHETLQAINISNPVTGGFDQAAQDAAWASLELWWEYGDKQSVVPGIAGSFAGGQLSFAGLGLDVKSGETLRLTLRGSASVTAPDGMILQPTINSGADLVFTDAVVLEGSWPLVAPGSLTVDGMTAVQITLHPVGAEIFQIGSVRNLALDVTLPSNGGVPDVLNKLNILNTGTALYPQVIDQMECWADNGDGLFNPAVDTWMAELRWTGGQRFEASALNQNVASAGLRVFVTVDIAEDALGGTLRLSLPAGDDLGVGMASGNDGPIDRSVTNPLAQTISATDRVILTTAPLSSRVVAPGESRVPVLHLVARNLYAGSRTIRQLNLNNITVGDNSASQADRDGTMSQLLVQKDGDGDGELDGPEIDPVVISTTWEGGTATFDGLDWSLSPDEVSHLFISASIDLLGAANGDMIGVVVGSALDVDFNELTAVVGAWPLDSGARYEVDGMVAAQVANPAVPPVSLTANEGPVLALDITVPGNGYLDDTLQTLRLANLGTAIPTDISVLALYDDQDGNGIFEPGTDLWLADFTGIGQDWVLLDVGLAIPAAGRRLFAGLTVASTPTDSATVRLAVPVDGLDMISLNDGPRDVAVESPTSLLMSTAPLLSNLAFSFDYSTTEMSVTVTMNVKNVGGEDVVDITPRDLAVTGDGGMTLFSGPLPASLDLAQGAEGTFTWVFDGHSQGPVFVTARCEGTGAVGGQPRGSLASGSAAHIVLDPALDLDLYPVANMPFSINRGQTGVVPMTLTLLNPGGPDRANLRLEQLVVTLDDGDGNPVVPADLLAHVTINEGANVFCDRSTLETTGQIMTLDLDPPVVVTDSEPVTLGLRLDILGDTTVDRFRVILMDPADLTVVDNVSHLPRTVYLSNGNFPVMSAAGSIVSQATGLVVSAPVQTDLTAGAGQEDVSLLHLELTGSGDDDASEVKVGGFAVMVVDTLGQALPDASAYLSRLWVEGPLGTNAAYDLSGPADSLVVFEMLPQVTVPVSAAAVALTVHGRVPLDSNLGPFHLRLEPTDTFDARDGNNSADVLVTYQPTEITGPRVTIQEPAPAMLVAVDGELPSVVSLGASDVLAMTVNLSHPGPITSAAVRLDTMRLDFLDINRQPQDPDAILDGYRVQWRGVDLSVPIFYENQQIVIPLGGRLLDPFTQGDLVLRVDIEADAPVGGFEMVLSTTGILASDNNLGLPVDLVAATGYSLPAGSNVAQLQPPSENVVAGWLDRMPPLLPTDEVLVEAMRLVLTNPAPAGAAPVELSSLVLRAADRHGHALAAGTMLSGVEVEFEGSVWAEISSPTLSDSTLTLTGSAPLVLYPGIEVALVIKVSGRADSGGDGLSIGLWDGDVLCTQPGSTTLVAVRPVEGETFPFWTAAAGLGKAALADSYINFPNPFAAGREQTSFAFNLDQPATVSLCIWTPRGESVTTLLNNKALAAGLYQDLVWDGRNGGGQAVRNGVYLAELKVQYEGGGSERLLRKVAVVR